MLDDWLLTLTAPSSGTAAAADPLALALLAPLQTLHRNLRAVRVAQHAAGLHAGQVDIELA